MFKFQNFQKMSEYIEINWKQVKLLLSLFRLDIVFSCMIRSRIWKCYSTTDPNQVATLNISNFKCQILGVKFQMSNFDIKFQMSNSKA